MQRKLFAFKRICTVFHFTEISADIYLDMPVVKYGWEAKRREVRGIRKRKNERERKRTRNWLSSSFPFFDSKSEDQVDSSLTSTEFTLLQCQLAKGERKKIRISFQITFRRCQLCTR